MGDGKHTTDAENVEKIHTIIDWQDKRTKMKYSIQKSRIWIAKAIAGQYLEGVLIRSWSDKSESDPAFYAMTYEAFLAQFEPVED